MAENLIIPVNSKREEKYRLLKPQLTGLIDGEEDIIANMANISAALKEVFNFLWVGFYQVKGKQLVLGPFQGPIACTRINYGKGVCGTAWKEKKTIIVPDVDQFPGHIACSSDSRSEIVVPLIDQNGNVVLVLDVDSEQPNDFNDIDKQGLEDIVSLLNTGY